MSVTNLINKILSIPYKDAKIVGVDIGSNEFILIGEFKVGEEFELPSHFDVRSSDQKVNKHPRMFKWPMIAWGVIPAVSYIYPGTTSKTQRIGNISQQSEHHLEDFMTVQLDPNFEENGKYLIYKQWRGSKRKKRKVKANSRSYYEPAVIDRHMNRVYNQKFFDCKVITGHNEGWLAGNKTFKLLLNCRNGALIWKSSKDLIVLAQELIKDQDLWHLDPPLPF